MLAVTDTGGVPSFFSKDADATSSDGPTSAFVPGIGASDREEAFLFFTFVFLLSTDDASKSSDDSSLGSSCSVVFVLLLPLDDAFKSSYNFSCRSSRFVAFDFLCGAFKFFAGVEGPAQKTSYSKIS